MKKLMCLLICVSLLLGILSCCDRKDPDIDSSDAVETTAEETTSAPVSERKITLGYYKGKSFNPFNTESPTNRNLMTLVYDGLFLATDNYTVEPLIAVSFTNNEKMLTVSLNTEAVFSDGSTITPNDVVYSFNQAKDSIHYSGRLRPFLSAAAGVDSVTFNLSAANIYAESCLTFPIVKYGTADKDIPTGSGRYSLTKKGSNYYLTANENSTRQEEMATQRITLVPISSDKGELYYLQTGDLTYFFDDLSDGEYTKIRANTARVSLNNMVYIGLHSGNKLLKNSKMTEAITYAISKTSLCDIGYSGIARASDIPFNPSWQAASGINRTVYEQNTIKAGELLEEIGYKYEYSTNKYRSKNYKFLELTMIVNNESEPKLKCARAIAENLRLIGIDLRLNEMPYDEYVSALSRGEFDLYLGEIKLTPDMSLSPFFSEGGSASYGVDTDSAAAKAYFDFVGGKIDISTFIQVFSAQTPFIPLLFREGISYYSRELTYEDTINEYEPFKNIYSWSVIN